MPTNTYVALDKVTVGTATSSITFSSIPQGYTDLVLVSNVRINQSGSSEIYCQPNGVGTANKSFTFLIGNGSSASSGRGSNDANIRIGAGTGTSQASGIFATSISNFMSYSNTTTFKTILSRGSDATNATQAVVGLFPSTNAITSIVIYGNSGVNILAGSTFSLYGIASSGAGAKATGGTITSDANYYYHTFLASGTFTPTQSLSCDYLVVAGGGGGGSYRSGGGGAGGFKTGSAFSVTATNYSITVGAGGTAGSTSTPYQGGDGTQSVFSTITSAGGGGGGGAATAGKNGRAGGSGGGGSGNDLAGTGGAGNSGEGNNGGTGGYLVSGEGGGGGGGGASAVGATGSSSTPGAGGAGTASSYSGASVTYSTGGIGGHGVTSSVPPVGAINTGNGGGGGNTGSDPNGIGAAGGSGVVIIRYAK